MGKSDRAVVFDVGGVMARICKTWQEAARVAGVKTRLGREPVMLQALPTFDPYQAGHLPESEYLRSLGTLLGVSLGDALEVHNGILIEPYPGTFDLVVALNRSEIRTGILSNTNGPHWEILQDPTKYPAIARCPMRMASHNVALEKPDPAIYARYEETFGLKASQIIFFDDNVANIESARRSGWSAHVIDPTGDPAEQIRNTLRAEHLALS